MNFEKSGGKTKFVEADEIPGILFFKFLIILGIQIQNAVIFTQKFRAKMSLNPDLPRVNGGQNKEHEFPAPRHETNELLETKFISVLF